MAADKKNVCEERVFQSVFEEHAEKVRNFIYYKCGDLELAEDIAQESFLRLWKRCAKVTFAKAAGFLFTVANNLFLDNTKHQKVVFKYQNTIAKDKVAPNPQFLMEEQEFKETLINAINELPEPVRVVFLMNRIEKMTYKEIAEFMGVSVKTIEKRMHKALVELRKLSKKI